jgi:hypothetical protein
MKVDIDDNMAKIVKTCLKGAFVELIPNIPFKMETEIKNSWE